MNATVTTSKLMDGEKKKMTLSLIIFQPNWPLGNQTLGGPDCETDDSESGGQGRWCYVNQFSNCNDKKESNLANGIEDKFLSQGKVYYTYAACQGNIKAYST